MGHARAARRWRACAANWRRSWRGARIRGLPRRPPQPPLPAAGGLPTRQAGGGSACCASGGGRSIWSSRPTGPGLLCHLGMSGRLDLSPEARAAEDQKPLLARRERHEHLVFLLARRQRLWRLGFVDPRRFGFWDELAPGEAAAVLEGAAERETGARGARGAGESGEPGCGAPCPPRARAARARLRRHSARTAL